MLQEHIEVLVLQAGQVATRGQGWGHRGDMPQAVTAGMRAAGPQGPWQGQMPPLRCCGFAPWLAGSEHSVWGWSLRPR